MWSARSSHERLGAVAGKRRRLPRAGLRSINSYSTALSRIAASVVVAPDPPLNDLAARAHFTHLAHRRQVDHVDPAKWARSSELSEDRLDSPKHLPSQSPVYVVELPAKRATQQASRGPQYPFDALQLFAVTPAIGRVELRRHATLDVGDRGQTELQRAEHVGFGNFPRSARTATRLTATGDLGHGGAVASSRDARLRFDPVGV
jgi:hypothetical protein